MYLCQRKAITISDKNHCNQNGGKPVKFWIRIISQYRVLSITLAPPVPSHYLQFSNHLLQIDSADLLLHYLHHLASDGAALRGLCVRSLLDLVGLLASETDAEESE